MIDDSYCFSVLNGIINTIYALFSTCVVSLGLHVLFKSIKCTIVND